MNAIDFCPRRFGAVLRRDLRMELSTWLWRILAMVAVMAAINLFFAWVVYHASGHSVSAQNIAITYVCWMSTSIFTTLGASHFMQGYATPGERLNQLMSPASTLEKFASRFVISVVGVTVAVIIAWYIAEAVRVVGGEYIFDAGLVPVTGWWTALCSFQEVDGANLFPVDILLMTLVTWQSFYVLGSAVWLKNAFLKTIAACFVLEFVFGFAAGFVAELFKDHLIISGITMSMSAIHAGVIVYMIICTLFAYITTYYRMREEEIIQRM